MDVLGKFASWVLSGRVLKKPELVSAIVSSNSYASFMLSKLPACIHNSIYARQARTNSLIENEYVKKDAVYKIKLLFEELTNRNVWVR